MREQDQVGADVYVDDAPHNIEQLRAHGHYAICFSNSTNSAVRMPKAKSWNEVNNLVKEVHPATKSPTNAR